VIEKIELENIKIFFSNMCFHLLCLCHPLRSRRAAVDHAPPIITHMTCYTKP